jgi:hypothetical protein
MKECTFSPVINEQTYKITSNNEARDTFQVLYDQAKVINKTKEELLKEKKQKHDDEQLEGCTFKPQIMVTPGIDIHVPNYDDKLEDRAQVYMKEKNERIKEYEIANANKIDEECTFKPKKFNTKIVEQQTEQNINVQSIDKYLERMNQAKEIKENIEKHWKNRIGSGKYWKDNMTIPEAPKLVGRAKQTRKPKALQKPITIDHTLKSDFSSLSFKRHESYPQTNRTQIVENCQSKAKQLLQKNISKEKELLRINDKMDYGQAQWAIHSYILDLDV